MTLNRYTPSPLTPTPAYGPFGTHPPPAGIRVAGKYR
jgi:hypothetical protein